MRIISGLYKNRKLFSPGDNLTHPMGERERNAVFNALGDITDLEVLDLFAGTGALGLEALSRGAAHATFVDNSPDAIKILQKNTSFLPPASFSIVKSDALSFTPSTSPDLIFCDPPYSLAGDLSFSSLAVLGKENTLFVFSLPKRLALSLDGFLTVFDKTYAACRIIICRKKNNMI